MIKRDIIKRRLDTPDESISYTEFAYGLLQGYDYMVLNEKYNCDLQIGATDQWTNILSGVELIRRKNNKEAFALVTPLVTDANGKKFGKSEGNAVWLDSKKTTPFAFYQFWLNQPDEKVGQYLMFYTFMSVAEINAIVELHSRNPGKREAQKMLAKHVTELVHGKEAAKGAETVSEVLYGGKELSELSPTERAILTKEAITYKVSMSELMSEYSIVDALVASELSASKSDARRLIDGKGVYLNGQQIESADAKLSVGDFNSNLAMLRRGKQIVVLTLGT
jgi:tyrosyl-tRNA synthetase